jgi:hypothetical protein
LAGRHLPSLNQEGWLSGCTFAANHGTTISIEAPVQSGRAVQYVTDPRIRTAVRESLAIHLGLDIPGFEDGAHLDAGFETSLAAPDE